MMDLIIRQETKADYEAVFVVVEAAFANQIYADQDEQFLVERLRKSKAFVPALSLVALNKNQIVGHILFTKVHIQGKNQTWESLCLAPVSVLPAFQNKGIGCALIRRGHIIAKRLNFKSILVLGHPNYYPKFGYQSASHFDIHFPFEAPDEACMAIELEAGALKGVKGSVVFPKAFF